MRLPPKDDPGGDRAAALPRAIVLGVLREHGVLAQALADSLYMLSQGAVFEAQDLTDPVGGLMIRRLARTFAIALVDFYYNPLTGNRRHTPKG